MAVVDCVGVAASDLVAVEEDVVPLQEPALSAATDVKLAQVMRVVLAKCNTKLRFPKKAPMPLRVEAKSSV